MSDEKLLFLILIGLGACGAFLATLVFESVKEH